MYLNLLSAISKDKTLSGETWSRGKLAYYLMAILSVCEDPRNFYDYNLVDTLQNHLEISSKYLNNNKFAYALIVLALCKAKEPVGDKYMKGMSSPGGEYTVGVGKAAMVYMAYHCVNDPAYSEQQTAALDYILSQQDPNGLFANSYVISTALALQVIFATGNVTLESRTTKGMKFLIESIDQSKKAYSARLLSVLPPVAKKSFLNIGEHCPETPVVTAVSWLERPEPVSAPVGTDVTLRCRVTGDPGFVTWNKDSLTIAIGTVNSTFIISDTSRLSMPTATKYNLQIKSVRKSDDGDYTCAVQNLPDGEKWVTVHLTVLLTTTTTTPSTPKFEIHITVFNNLTSGFDQTWSVSIHEGETLFKAMQNLQATDPSFSFTSKPSTWGQFITSVCNMTASTDDRQYWQILDKNDKPSQTGASTTFPSDGDSYTLKLTTW